MRYSRFVFLLVPVLAIALLMSLLSSAANAAGSIPSIPVDPFSSSGDVAADEPGSPPAALAFVKKIVPPSQEEILPWVNQLPQVDGAESHIRPWAITAPAAPTGIESVGDWDSNRVNFPRVISDSGQYRMWYDGQNPFMGWQIGLAESANGIAWTKHSGNPLIGVGAPGEWDSGYRGQLAVMQDGGLYKLWFSGGPDGVGPWQTGYATSTNGVDWNIYPGNPVLPAGGGGAWDEAESDGPSVIKDGSLYKMWYHGCNGDYSVCSIGYATSTNSIDWAKYSGNPVLTQGNTGDWDEGGIVWPYVIKNGSTYYLWYHSNGQIGLATSPDGLAWTKSGSNPVLTTGWDGAGVVGQAILLEGSTYKMWFRSGAGASIGIGYAESTDGINWTMPYSNPVLAPGAPNMVIDVNYAHDWVYAAAAPNATVAITLADGGGIKATVTGQSDWQGDFRSWEWSWAPGPPDIQPGDIVTASAAGETTIVNPIGTFDGVLDTVNDLVTVTLNAKWFTQTLNATCNVEGGPGEGFTIDPDDGSYTCDFSPTGMNWDLLPGQNVWLWYWEPDGDRVGNVLRIPVPEVGVGKWAPSGHARPGGVYVYGVYYANNGDGVATDTVIVDTLPVSTTWAGDTSGVAPVIGPNGVITWNLGNLPPSSEGVFMVTLQVGGNVPTGTGAIGPNCAFIATTAFGDDNPGNDNACSGPVDVWIDDAGVNIDKWPNPGDPAPGQEFEYTVRWCSDRGAAAGPAWLTDTLPVSTTLLSWRPQNWWERFWVEEPHTGSQLVLYAPGLPGNMCQELYLRLLLDPAAQISTTLVNHVIVVTPGDIDPGNNERTNSDAHVSGPRYDMNTNKWYNQGVLAPGGWIRYGVNYWNAGNTIVHALITDTLPPGTSYQLGSGQLHNGQPFPPIIVTDDYVVWDLGLVNVNDGFGFDLALNISDTLTSPATLTNCVTVGITLTEDTPGDNTACVEVTVNDPGPNLRVTKWSWWNGDGQLGYQIQFENIGDQTIDNVWITDTLPDLTNWDGWWDMGFEWGRLISQNLGSDVLAWEFSELYPGDSGWLQFNANLDEPGAPMRWYTNTVEISAPPGDVSPADNVYTDVAFSGGEVNNVDLDLYRTRIWGYAPQGPITITDDITETVLPWSGNFDIEFGDGFMPGEVITVAAGAGLQPVVIYIPTPFTADASSITDMVWGQIDALDHEMVEIDLWGFPQQHVQTDGSGNYGATFADVPRGAQGDVNYYATVDYTQVGFHRRFQSPDLLMNVNYGHDWVEGSYETGYTLWLTVTASDGVTIKATAELTTGVIPWWGGQTGFSTNLGEPWVPQRPDMTPGDWVFATMNNGYTSTARIGTIDGALDIDLDVVTATYNVSWFTQPLNANCSVENGPGEGFTVDPAGGSHVCNFGSMGWNLLPHQNVWLWYTEPDGDQVGNVVYEPAPHLRVEKWAEGNPAAGSNFIFRLQYRNEGDADAANVVITDTLLGGMAYITDTSGLPHSGSNPVVWDLGTLAPGDWIQFDVFVNITAVESDTITNTAQIATSNPYDEGEWWEKYSEWSGHVGGNDTQLNIGKNAWTGDPAPGYDVVFTVNPCNNGATASSQVVLTDTLHPSMTLQTWWAASPGWVELSSSSNQLVLGRPLINSGSCEQVYVRAHVDENAWSGLPISNTAVVYAANDLTTGDDETTWWGNVNNPHTNLNINKNWNWGQLVPGGELRYNINYGNNGNVPVGAFRITDTLPVSTSFEAAWWYDQYGPHYMTPVFSGTAYVVWEIAGLDNGYNNNFEVVLRVDTNAFPGTVLTNTAEISPLPGEDTYDDNTSTAVELLNDHGPNVRVTKWGDWHGDYEGHAWYQFSVENVGDVDVPRVVVTDTYPLSMTLEGDPWTDWGRVSGYTRNDAGHWFTFTMENVHSGYRLDFGFNATVATPVPLGLILTNTAEVTLTPGDINPNDNVSQYVLSTGPDLYIEKTLVGGELLPGELVTFSLRYGNDQPGHTWWWSTQGNVWITDTLPMELEYITSTQRWCSGPDCPYIVPAIVGNQLAFNVGPQGAGWWNEIYLTVRITDSATGLDTFTNWAEIASDQPSVDIEPYYDNNSSYYDIVITLPYFELFKGYASSLVAGMPLTYTLTVTNIGSVDATGVVVTDALPLEVGGGVASWAIPSLAANGGVTQVITNVVLPCTAGTAFTNQWYRVASSDQGVTSDWGPALALATISPTLNAAFDYSANSITVNDTVWFTSTSSTNGADLSYEWNWGDGSAHVFAANAMHQYLQDGTFTVTLTIADACGFTAYHEVAISVAAPDLVAGFEYAPSSIVVNGTVTFTDTSTTNVPPIVARLWDFGDNATSSAQHPTHQYTAVGTYTVSLLVTDSLGYSDTATGVVVVNPPTLVAGFEYAPSSVVVSGTVTFTDTSTTDVPPIVAWLWNFDDGSTSSEQHPTHQYTAVGTYTVSLLVTDSLGYSDTATGIVTVVAPTLTADFEYAPSSIVVNGTVIFTDTSTTNVPPIVAWLWNFDDGSTSSEQHPTHQYTAVGTYTVSLLVTDSLGYSDIHTIVDAVIVNLSCVPVAGLGFGYLPMPAIVQQATLFTATYTAGSPTPTFEWSFDGGAPVSGQSAVHTFTTPGAHTVAITATNTCGPAYYSQPITVQPRRIYLPLVLRNS